MILCVNPSPLLMQEGQFKPIPFGIVPPPSAFTLAAAPEHAAVWDHFRSIDSDKEARVLQVRSSQCRVLLLKCE
jgi:hypothetical protein